MLNLTLVEKVLNAFLMQLIILINDVNSSTLVKIISVL